MAASPEPRYAVFVSPHGFGHAARASAVMAELHRRERARFEVFSTVPRWFFDESIAGAYRYHEMAVGSPERGEGDPRGTERPAPSWGPRPRTAAA